MYKAFLDKLPSGPVLFFGGIYFFMPILPEPHLWQKFQMITSGAYMQPIDYLDIVVHAGAGIIALSKFLRDRELAKLGFAASATTGGGDTQSGAQSEAQTETHSETQSGDTKPGA